MLRRIATEGGLVYLRSDLLHAAGVPHAFSTRIGGVSPPPFDSLNLGNPTGGVQDDWSNIYENYRRLQAAIGAADHQRCWVHQVHGGEVAVARNGVAWESGAKADAIAGDDPRRILAIRTADCVPVLLASADGRFVAAVHAGWRGVIAGVVGATVDMMRRWTDASLLAAIGPAISFEHFEVSTEVLRPFAERFGADPLLIRRDSESKGRVNLPYAVQRQLCAAGLDESRIDTADLCTVRERQSFFSHRRDAGVTGRMSAIIAPLPAAQALT